MVAIQRFDSTLTLLIIICRAGEPEPVGAGCVWLLGAGAA